MGNATFTEGQVAHAPRGSYVNAGHAMLLIADPAAAADGERAIADAGGRLLQCVAWKDVAATLPQIVATPVVLVQTTKVEPATLDAVLPVIRDFLIETSPSPSSR